MSVSCPKCFEITPEDRRIGDKYFCDCGWRFQVANQQKQTPVHKDKSSLLICLFGGLILFSFMHVVSWDTYFFKIIPIKAAHATGLAGTETIAELSNICEERKKYECVLDTLSELYEKNPLQQVEALHKKGKLLVKLERFEEATKIYSMYFENNGTDPEAHYQYAKSLRMLSQVPQATEQYQLALAAKPDVLQISVTRSFVDMLIQNRNYKYAKDIITHYRGKAQHSKYFLESELKTVNEALGKPSKNRRTSSI